MDELLLKARAMELLQAEKKKARFRIKACCLMAGLTVGVLLSLLLHFLNVPPLD